jgi:leucine dehydrogenase
MLAYEHEALLRYRDRSCGYLAFVAIHSTALGPATGGTRIMSYESESAAILDVLRLSRAMSYKAAIAGLPAGGGKSVILANGIRDREAVLEKHAQVIESLGGRYITAPDVGTSVGDIELMARRTSYVSRHALTGGGNGPDTARGVFAAIRGACCLHRGRASLAGMRVAIQGVGHVGAALAELLVAAGADVIVSDVRPERAEALARRISLEIADPALIHRVPVDVFAPCGMGETIDGTTIAELRCHTVVGGANNQLADDEGAAELLRRGITFVPDSVSSAGGLIAGVCERMGFSLTQTYSSIDAIAERTAEILERAVRQHVSPWTIADQIGSERLVQGSVARSRAC